MCGKRTSSLYLLISLMFTTKVLRKDTTLYASYSKSVQSLGFLFKWQVHIFNCTHKPFKLTCVLPTSNQLLITFCKSQASQVNLVLEQDKNKIYLSLCWSWHVNTITKIQEVRKCQWFRHQDEQKENHCASLHYRRDAVRTENSEPTRKH